MCLPLLENCEKAMQKVKREKCDNKSSFYFWMDLAPRGFSPLMSFFALACANRDFGFALEKDFSQLWDATRGTSREPTCSHACSAMH
jgi:hypothetical protein